MKAPAFWYRPPGAVSGLLSPLGAFYQWGAALRRQGATPYKAKTPVICVGNVVTGGSGKTPTALALAAFLKQRGARPAFVTRGYGGREAGPLRVDAVRHASTDVGDEALLLARVAPTWVGRDRPAAIREAEKDATHIILDDGLQNPHIAPDVGLLVIDAAVGLGNGCLIPAGPLREPLVDALRRVQAVIAIGGALTEDLEAALRDARIPIIAAHLEIALPEAFPRNEPFIAFAGIGRPEKFYRVCREAGLKIVTTQDYPDHHVFRESELEDLQNRAKKSGARLLTTEKDWVRLPPDMQKSVSTLPVSLIFDTIETVSNIIKM